jgi:hypothetical protein
MKTIAIASADTREALKNKAQGEPVNVHVVPNVQEPEPDYEKMRRIVEGESESDS